MNVIKVGRAKKELSQKKLAEIMGVTRQTVFNWEQKTNQPNASAMLKLSEVLDVSIEEVVRFYDKEV